MKLLRPSLVSLPLLCALTLAACSDRSATATTGSTTADPGAQPSTALGRAVAKGMEKARTELANGNIQLNGFNVSGYNKGITINAGDDANDSRPKAEITPQGELLIDGRKVAANAEQQVLLKEYRGQIEQIAMAGMDVGVAGADLGMKAAGEAIAAVFSGNGDQVDQRMEAEAAKIEAAAMKLCDQLPDLLDTQTRLAAAMPEFRPYATMDQADVDDCARDASTTSEQARAEVRDNIRSDIRNGIRNGIRGGIQGVTQAAGLAKSGTGDTVTVNGVRFLLPPGGVSTDSHNGDTTIEVSNGLRVRLDDSGLSVNGERYPAPKANGEVDLSNAGTVKVDGETVSAL